MILDCLAAGMAMVASISALIAEKSVFGIYRGDQPKVVLMMPLLMGLCNLDPSVLGLISCFQCKQGAESEH